jgi:CarD family transcriptional regulator
MTSTAAGLSTASPDEEGGAVAVGDAVVYRAHGVGRVVAREHGDVGGATREFLVIDLATGLRVRLPVEDAPRRLRAVADDADIETVARVLAADPGERERAWPKRLQVSKEKLAAGCAAELAELVRDGRLAELAGNGASRLSHTERALYMQARELLAREIAWARRVEVDQVEVWIDARIGAAGEA